MLRSAANNAGNAGKCKGFKIIAQKILRLTENQIKKFYYVHQDKPFFMDLCSFMISGPVIVQVLEGEIKPNVLKDFKLK